MDRKRQRAASSPPRSTPNGNVSPPSRINDIVTRTFDLVTSREVLPYYFLAAWFSFYYAPSARMVPDPRPLDHVVFKMLPVVYLIELVRHPPLNTCPMHDHVRGYIVLGLAICSVGDGVLAWDPDYLGASASLFCVGYLCYAVAFYQYYQPTKHAKFVFPVGLVLVSILIFFIPDLTTSVLTIIYAGFLTTLAFFAFTRLELCRSGPSYLGWAGVKLFVMSDIMLGMNELVPELDRPVSDTVVAMTYYLGQLGVALSTYTVPACPDHEPCASGKKASTPRMSASTHSVKSSRSRSP